MPLLYHDCGWVAYEIGSQTTPVQWDNSFSIIPRVYILSILHFYFVFIILQFVSSMTLKVDQKFGIFFHFISLQV